MIDSNKLLPALYAIGEAARMAERRGDDLGEHSVSPEEMQAIGNALRLIRRADNAGPTLSPTLLRGAIR